MKISNSNSRELRWPVSFFYIGRLIGLCMEGRLLVNEPAVSTPQDKVEETKNNWGIESPHVRQLSTGASVVGIARLHICIHICRIGGKFYISQPFGPGRRRSEPQEGQKSSQEKIQHWGTARLPVHMLIAQVHDEHGSAVQEAEHSDAHKVFSRWCEVSNQPVVRGGVNGLVGTVWYAEGMLRHSKWIIEVCRYFLRRLIVASDVETGGAAVASSCGKGKYGEHPFKHTYEGEGLFQRSKVKPESGR